jgi:hypothetical protein
MLNIHKIQPEIEALASYTYVNPCGGGVEYLHRDPASRKRRRNGAKKAAP